MELNADIIKKKALEMGFSACGIAKVEEVESEEMNFLNEWLQKQYQAEMNYMANHIDIRHNPNGLVEGAKSIISVALNYYPSQLRDSKFPHIAYYAYGKDYHILLKDKLRLLWHYILSLLPKEIEIEARVFTDSAPILERYWAWKAGIGWIGKNTNLIIPKKGSFFFLGEIISTLPADKYDKPMKSKCGSCRRCLDACPTGALERAHVLNANKCISYQTIENRGEIPAEIVSKLGNRVYGCDTCQLACPWNQFATPNTEMDFQPKDVFLQLDRERLRNMTREDYTIIFSKSAIKRAKYEGLMRNISLLEDESIK